MAAKNRRTKGNVDVAGFLGAFTGDGGEGFNGEELYRAGVILVEKGRYRDGLKAFASALKAKPNDPVLQAYFGLCLAGSEKRLGEGLRICETAMESHFYRSELYLVLSKVYVIAGSRKRAFQTLHQGLKVDPDNQLIQGELKKLSTRTAPTFPFLRRNNPLNVMTGKMRHKLRRS